MSRLGFELETYVISWVIGSPNPAAAGNRVLTHKISLGKSVRSGYRCRYPGEEGLAMDEDGDAGLARTFRFETCLADEEGRAVCCPKMVSEEESRVMGRKREAEKKADPRRSGEQDCGCLGVKGMWAALAAIWTQGRSAGAVGVAATAAG